MKTKEIKEEIEGLVKSMNTLPLNKRRSAMEQLEKLLADVKLPHSDVVDGFIYKTSDLSQFNTVLGNRLINENTAYIRQLAESINNYGNVTPIIVNKNFETIDGQRRLSAIKNTENLKKEIRYIKDNDANIDIVGDINRLQVKWSYKDWLNKYVSMGYQDYIKYEELEKQYSHIMKPRSLRTLLMHNRVSSFKRTTWENGEFTIDYDNLEANIKYLNFLGLVQEMGGTNNIFADNRDFQNALHQVYKNIELLDEERLHKRIRLGYAKLNIKTDLAEYKNILAEIYDAKLPKKQTHIEEIFNEEIGVAS